MACTASRRSYGLSGGKVNKPDFWKLIDGTRREASPSDDIAPLLVDTLAAMEPPEIIRWAHMYDAYQSLSYKPKLWAAAYLINGGCSDDGFEYFRGWLISRGRAVFLSALADPDSLADVDIETQAEYEDMLSVGALAYFKKLGMARPDYDAFQAACRTYDLSEIERQHLVVDIHYASDSDAEWDEDGLEAVVPRLCAKFG